jgi:hypothetical protein
MHDSPTPSSPPVKYKRRKKLIQPGLQFALTKHFLVAIVFALLFQFTLFAMTISQLAADLPNDSTRLLDAATPAILKVLLVSLVVFLPLTVYLGIRTTFRVAGPLYRFGVFLRAVERGEQVEECRIRELDHLHDFCALLNRVTSPLRAEASRRQESESGEQTRDAA